MRVLITGVTGMDGWHLGELLVEQGHAVYGLIRGQRSSTVPAGVEMIRGDLLDQASLCRALVVAEPEIVYNLAALTAIATSWGQPDLMSNITGLGTLRLLEAIRLGGRDVRFVQASSADMFGVALESPQNELTPFRPNSPYGAAKLLAHQVTCCYRDAYGIHASNMIMFNHTSERHGDEFVVRKVCKAAARIARGEQEQLALGSLDAWRDWGYAPDYMRAWALAGQAEKPDDYVLATGELRSLTDLVRTAFAAVDLDWEPYVVTDTKLTRPVDVRERVGDPGKAAALLGWIPTVDFDAMITSIVHHDLDHPEAP